MNLAGRESVEERDNRRQEVRRVPYEKVTELPESVREHLPKHAQEIYKSAFNSAEKQYGEEGTAHKVAWSAVENKYKKDENSGDWVSKDS